jgi:hypothetical protein
VNDQYKSVHDLVAKVEWEGGVTEAIAGYGIPPSRLPDDVPEEVREAWRRIYDIRDDVNLVSRWLDAMAGDDDE